jgi:tripartite-type tricarboxylate transporter receptor subunit TctC
MKLFKFLSILILPAIANAWEPTHPITVLIGNKPGSGNEVGFRAIAAEVTRINPKIEFIISNKPGADSVIAMNALMTAKPDGYTVAVPSYMSTFVTNDIWQKDIKRFKYDDFTYIMGMGKSPLAFVANAKSSVTNIDQLAERVKNTDQPITFALGGGAHRMAYEYFMFKVGGNKQLVKNTQFPGPLQAVTAVATDAGMEFGIMPIAIAKPLVDAGKVKVLGITGDRAIESLPGISPVMAGDSNIDIFAAWALILPPNTPQEIVSWYQRVFEPALRSGALRKYYDENLMFLDLKETTPQGFTHGIERLRAVWMPLAQQVDLSE